MPNGTFNGFAKLLHWLVVVLLVAQFAIAWTMPDVHRDTKPVDLIAWHLSVGMTILLVMVVRLGWRTVSTVPPTPAGLAVPLAILSRVTQFSLYALLFALPVLGWINANARGWTVSLFGAIPMPALVATGSGWGHQMGDVHQVVAWVLLGAAALHVTGALFHQFILKDSTLRRMLPGHG